MEGRRGKGRGREGKGHEPPHYLEEVSPMAIAELIVRRCRVSVKGHSATDVQTSVASCGAEHGRL